VSDSGKLQWPNGKRGICGDAWNETKFGHPGNVEATYKAGQAINVDVLVAINHMGNFKMHVCPLKGHQGCTPLRLKAPGHTHTLSWFLPGVRKWSGGNYGGEPPRYGERREGQRRQRCGQDDSRCWMQQEPQCCEALWARSQLQRQGPSQGSRRARRWAAPAGPAALNPDLALPPTLTPRP
jgi:hypothetical protein